MDRTDIRLFGFLPLWRKVFWPHKTKFYLLGLPLLKIARAPLHSTYLLFHFIPVFRKTLAIPHSVLMKRTYGLCIYDGADPLAAQGVYRAYRRLMEKYASIPALVFIPVGCGVDTILQGQVAGDPLARGGIFLCAKLEMDRADDLLRRCSYIIFPTENVGEELLKNHETPALHFRVVANADRAEETPSDSLAYWDPIDRLGLMKLLDGYFAKWKM
jgi:hypothetical protein